MMDILSRVRDVLSGKKSYKRKSTFADELELSATKRSRISDMNGDYSDEVLNSLINQDPNAYMRNPNRRADSYVLNHSKPSYFGSFDHPRQYTNDHNGPHTNYNFHNFDHADGFKQPMPPPIQQHMSNGTKRIPQLLSAGRSAFSRNFNRPQQTINPHYNRFGEPSELQNFKTIPDLYPIPRQNRQNSSASYSNLVNGHDPTSMRHGSLSNQRFMSNHSNLQSSAMFNNNKSIKSMGLTGNSIIAGKSNPPINLDRANYQNMLLNMIPGYSFLKKSKKNTVDETSLIAPGIIDLSEEADTRNKSSSTFGSQSPKVERVNSLKARIETNELFNRDWEKNVNEKYSSKSLGRRDSLKKLEQEAEECERKSRDTEDRLKESFNKITISSIVYEEEEEEVPANDYPRLEQEMQQKIYQWVNGRNSGTIISKFNLSISPHDIQTLQWTPLTWLNDEVINFFMELLAERSRTNENLPKVHGMNTFFLKRLLENGYSGVRRWTRKVDIFAHDIIPVPVHKGIHWCMAIIHMKNKTIKYYDSMGAPNNSALNALAEYLKAESLDKKKVEFDMTGWKLENVRNIPQQENGSDCGVFSCMYAEFVTRNRPIVFTQQHMQYFRMKMVYEICTGKMLN